MRIVRHCSWLAIAVLTAGAVESLVAQTNISFPDPNLEAAVRSALSQPVGPITSIGLLSLTNLSAYGDGITDLSGLEWASNLTNLDLEANVITDLSALAGLAQLQDLSLGSNRLANLDALSGLTNLGSIAAADNRLVDIGALLSLSYLSNADVRGNQLNLAPGSETMTVIQTLINRGVHIDYEPQAPDTTPPTLRITSGPPANSYLTNAFVQFVGVASDNISVAAVEWQLSNADRTTDWQSASGTQHWSSVVSNLVEGVNTVRIRAWDAATNVSTVVSRSFSLDAIIPTVSITTGPPSDARLTNSTVHLEGTAGDDLKLAAVEWQLTSANGTTGWRAATGTTNWTASITGLTPGLNTVRVRARDAAGNLSVQELRHYTLLLPLTVTVEGCGTISPDDVGTTFKEPGVTYNLTAVPCAGGAFRGWSGGVSSADTHLSFVMREGLVLHAKFAVLTPLTVSIYGCGSLIPDDRGATLKEPGKTYSLRAVPCAGYAFREWTGGISSVKSNLTYVMKTGLVLQANFYPLYTPVKGTYSGLFCEAGQVAQHSSGSFTLTTTTRRTFSGTLRLAGTSCGLSGSFDLTGHVKFTPSRRRDLTLDLQMDTASQARRLVGTVSDGNWTATLAGDLAEFDGNNLIAPQNGKYTWVLPGNPGNPANPGGDGYGTVTVSKAGKVGLVAVLADNTKLSQSSTVSGYGQWPLYASLYKNQGAVVGWMTFTNAPTEDLNGALRWINPGMPTSKYYPAGFVMDTMASGSRYEKPTGRRAVLNQTNAVILFTGGGLQHSITNRIILRPNGGVKYLDTNKLNLKFSLSSGLFSGTVTDPATKKSVPFNGAVLQKSSTGGGCFFKGKQSGWVGLEPRE